MKSCLAGEQKEVCNCAEVQFQSPNVTTCDTANFETGTLPGKGWGWVGTPLEQYKLN